MVHMIQAKKHLLRKDNFRKTTRELMDMMFTNAEMASSSVTGSKGHAGSTKSALDPSRVSFIIGMFKLLSHGLQYFMTSTCSLGNFKSTFLIVVCVGCTISLTWFPLKHQRNYTTTTSL